MTQVATYKLSAEFLERDFSGQLFSDYSNDFERDDGTEYILQLNDGVVNQALQFPGIDGLTDLIIRPVSGNGIAVTIGPIIYNQMHKISVDGVWGFIGAEPLDPTNIFITYNPGNASVASVRIYYAGLMGATIVPPPPPPSVDFTVGTFTAVGTGFTVGPSGTANYAQFGPLVVLSLPALSAVSNATTFTITGMPAGIAPSITETFLVRITDNGEEAVGVLKLTSGSQVIEIFSSFSGTEENPFINSGTKGSKAITITYQQL